jgi:DNA-binding transcriptional MerR regulator
VTAVQAPHEAPYTLRQLQQMLGISQRVIAGLVREGFVTPARGPHNAYRFTFQDLVLMRTAHALQSADIPTARILRSLRRLRESLPAELPLSGLRITAVGDRVAVRDGDAHWEPESGQLVMDFEVAPTTAGVAAFASVPARDEPSGVTARGPRDACADPQEATQEAGAQALFDLAQALEETDPAQAEATYRTLLRLAPAHADAWLNLGAMLCDANRCAEAVTLYETALGHCPGEALLSFNLAIALEDVGRLEEALERYAQCLAQDPEFADAHFNAARVHQQLGHQQMALRHFNAYRRLQKG